MEDYSPIVRGAEGPEVAVALRVEDARPPVPNRDMSDIGIIHETFGSAIVVQVGDPAAISYLVQAATKNALSLARIGVSTRAPRMLVVTIHKFWVTVPSREAMTSACGSSIPATRVPRECSRKRPVPVASWVASFHSASRCCSEARRASPPCRISL